MSNLGHAQMGKCDRQQNIIEADMSQDGDQAWGGGGGWSWVPSPAQS